MFHEGVNGVIEILEEKEREKKPARMFSKQNM
jgi:hypothetical protein